MTASGSGRCHVRIGARKGSFKGMSDNRIFKISMPDGKEKEIAYDGTPVDINFAI